MIFEFPSANMAEIFIKEAKSGIIIDLFSNDEVPKYLVLFLKGKE